MCRPPKSYGVAEHNATCCCRCSPYRLRAGGSLDFLESIDIFPVLTLKTGAAEVATWLRNHLIGDRVLMNRFISLFTQ